MSYPPRKTPRRPTNKGGVAKIGNKEVAVVLRDVSGVGARLRFLGNVEVPDRFKLVAPMEKIDAECVVVWRRSYDIGVRFET